MRFFKSNYFAINPIDELLANRLKMFKGIGVLNRYCRLLQGSSPRSTIVDIDNLSLGGSFFSRSYFRSRTRSLSFVIRKRLSYINAAFGC